MWLCIHHVSTQQQKSTESCQHYAHSTYFISFSLLGSVAIHSGIFHICILAHASGPVMGLFLHIKLFPNIRLCALMFYIIYHLNLAREMPGDFPFQPFHKVEWNDPSRLMTLAHRVRYFWTGPLIVPWCTTVYQWFYSWI